MPDKPSRVAWLDYCRGFITILVVAHHSSLAYTTFASFNSNAYILSTHPVVDPVRARSLDYFEDFNDVFFMSLMFLISGVFVLPALNRKGPKVFVTDRLRRLFIPFLIGVTILMPIAYLPAWNLAKHNWRLADFLLDYVTVEAWPVGPPWFIWVLFAFNVLFVLLYRSFRTALQKASLSLADRPARLWGQWLTLTAVCYWPLVLLAGADKWTGLGPFDFQVSRILLYFGYFILGICIGSGGPAAGLLAPQSAFRRAAPFFLIACALAYLALRLSPTEFIYRLLWPLSCTASSIAFLSVFSRLFRRSYRVWDSLSANAYGIYLVHYIFVTWCQYGLLPLSLRAEVKFGITFISALLLSWGLTALFRRSRFIARYL